MINAFINPEPLRILTSNFEKSTEYCNHPTVASIRISNVDWTNDEVFQIRKMCASRKGKMAARNVLGGVYQPGKALSIPMREEIINLYNQGYHTKEISRDLKVIEHTVRNTLDHFRRYDSCKSDNRLHQTTRRNIAGNSSPISAWISILTSEHVLSKKAFGFSTRADLIFCQSVNSMNTMLDERAQNGAFVPRLLHRLTNYRSVYCSLVQSTFDIRMDATVGWLQHSVDFSRFEVKIRSGSGLMNSLIIT